VDQALATGGHAIEVRLYAEDAEADFLPATGRIERLIWPSGPGIRVDAGIDEGSMVGSRFDPMLAKIIALGSDRPEALERLTGALDDTVVLGLTTNLRFLRWLVRQPAVRAGQMRIDTLERIWPPDDWGSRATTPDEAWRTAGRALAGSSGESGWRLNGPARLRLASEGETRFVELSLDDRRGTDVVVSTGTDGTQVANVDVAGRSVAFRLALAPDVDRAARAATAQHGTGGPAEVVAPMPGSILAIHAKAGAMVKAGDPVATLEAMKMEHAVVAPVAGRIAELRARPGDQVARGDVLAVVEP
jgi:acetyl-CoA/propionyl-CoA carboxylase biotin carboxyl carrier protein